MRTTPVRDVMTTDVLAFKPSDSVDTAARALAGRRLGGAPVVDDGGRVVGLLEDDDLIVQEARIHFPTVISLLGAYLELPSSLHRFEKEVRKAVGATVVADRPRPGPTTSAPKRARSARTASAHCSAGRESPVTSVAGRSAASTPGLPSRT